MSGKRFLLLRLLLETETEVRFIAPSGLSCLKLVIPPKGKRRSWEFPCEHKCQVGNGLFNGRSLEWIFFTLVFYIKITSVGRYR